MHRSVVLCLSVATLGVLVASAQMFAQSAPVPSSDDAVVKRALEIHERVLTLDTHVDISGPTYATPANDPGAPSSSRKGDLTKMEKGKVDGVFLAVFVGQGPTDAGGYAKAWENVAGQFEALHRLTGTMYPARAGLATSPDEVVRVAATGRRAVMIGMENGYPLGAELANVKKVYDLGARYITLTHTDHNQLADSSGPKAPRHNGLSEFGKQVVVEMNRLGMMVDVSHGGEKTFWDVLAVTKAPIIASHSGARALCDHDRNLTDDQLRALAKNGGVVQTVALSSYLKAESPARREAMMKLREEAGLPAFGRGAGGSGGGRPTPAAMSADDRAEFEKKIALYRERMKAVDAQYPGATIQDFMAHLDYLVKVAGIDHVGIGTDFDGGGGVPGYNDASEAPNVTIELVKRGYTEDQIRKIWGGNLLRAWRQVEQVAAGLQK